MLLKAIGDFERISDHAVNILESAEEMREKGIVFSEDEIPCRYFSASDPYLKHEPMQENRPRRNIRFDENGNIVVTNISANWILELAVTEEVSGTIYTVTGSYEGEDSFIRKLERIADEKHRLPRRTVTTE